MKIYISGTNVIAGFPGVGKSTLVKNSKGRVSDSDSSKFPKDDFPRNYIEHIQQARTCNDFVLVSSHKAVREALVASGIPFVLAYPDVSLKEEYMSRYRRRGSPSAFINLLDKMWDTWIAECEQQTGCQKLVLQSGQYLGDVL